jgi:hypothetical protein
VGCLVGGDPGRKHPGGVQVAQQGDAELRLGLEHDLLAHPRSGAALGVLGPFLGKVDAGAHLSMPAPAGVGAVHDVDRVGDLPGAAHVLAGHSGRAFALLFLPRLIQDGHRVRIGQVLDDKLTHDAHRVVFIPHRVVEQPLHLVRRAVPRPLGQRPAVLARDLAQ